MGQGRIAWLSLVVVVVVVGAGCHRSRSGPGAPTAAAAPQRVAPHTPVPIGNATTGSTVALARVDGRRIAFVADTDTSLIRRFDLDTRAELRPIAPGTTPGPLLVLPDGHLLTLGASEGKLVAISGFEAVDHNGSDRAWMSVPAEPVALALSPDGAAIYVTSGWTHALTGFRVSDFEQTFTVDLAREPRSIVVSDDGARVFVAHAVGSHMSVVDVGRKTPTVRLVPLRSADPRALDAGEDGARRELPKRKAARLRRVKDGLPTCQSFALAKSAAVPGRVLIPEVAVDPGETEQRSEGYGSSEPDDASEVPVVAVIDAANAVPVRGSLTRVPEAQVRASLGNGRRPCLLPRAATIDDRTRTLLVACQGIDALVAFDALSASPARTELRRWDVGAGPNGVAIDPEARQAVVWSQFDRTLSIVPLDEPERPTNAAQRDRVEDAPAAPVTRIAAAPVPMTSIALGRTLFHRTSDQRISGDGRACASCHPDGRDDGLVWSTPEGARRTIMLAGRVADTAPFSWQGNTSTMQKHLHGTFRRLGGTGLEGAELDALVDYVKSLSAVTQSATTSEAKAGAAIFLSNKAGCSSCHLGPSLTDGAMHDVGSGRAFNTPSLIGVGSTGPWFHDGRYGTLGELLRKSDGKMGHTKHLSARDLDALETFLRTL